MQGTRGAPLTAGAGSGTGGRRRLGVLLSLAAVIAVVDQATKIMALEWLGEGRVVPVVDGILQLRLVRNPGAAFGLAENLTVLLALIVLVVIFVILRMSRRLTNLGWAIGLAGLLGGAVGNLGDRLFRQPGPFRGHVIDFLELPHWPVFNVADSAVVAGAVLIALLSVRGVSYDGSRPRASSGGEGQSA